MFCFIINPYTYFMLKTNICTYHLPVSTSFVIKNLNSNAFEHPTAIHRHDYWEIFLFKSGCGRHQMDFKSFPSRKNSIHFVYPYQVHFLEPSSKVEAKILLIKDELIHEALENNLHGLALIKSYFTGQIPIINLDKKIFQLLWELSHQMEMELTTKSPSQLAILKNYLSIFLCKCLDLFQTEIELMPNSAELFLLHKYKLLVEANFLLHHKINDYLKWLNLTDKKLNTICANYLGLSPSEYLYNRILIEAKRLLKHSAMCQKEIAAYLNFTDVSHFIKFFKSKVGVSPKTFAIH